MASIHCTICQSDQENVDPITPRAVLIKLVCGHTFNWVTGECYTEKQAKDKESILCATINALLSSTKERQKVALKAVQDII